MSHGFDEERNCIYFHCASEGRKIRILKANQHVWGPALIDDGYLQGHCDHFYLTAQFHGTVTFVNDPAEKEHALQILVRHLGNDPERIFKEQITAHLLNRVTIRRIDIDFMSGKEVRQANHTTLIPVFSLGSI